MKEAHNYRIKLLIINTNRRFELMQKAQKRVERDENQEILELLENSAVNFANAELNRSRLRKIRDNQDNFNLDIWKNWQELGWLDLAFLRLRMILTL